MYKYFCDSCGYHFTDPRPERDERGLLNDISCPRCGAWEIYTDDERGARDSVRDLTEYENKIREWV